MKYDPIYYQFLDKIKANGKCNIYDAAKELTREYCLPAGKARHILIDWMRVQTDRYLYSKREAKDET